MKKELVDQPLALRLLDAQLATGGLVCPARRLRLPMEAALRLGCLDEETQQHLSRAASWIPARTRASATGSCWPAVSPTWNGAGVPAHFSGEPWGGARGLRS